MTTIKIDAKSDMANSCNWKCCFGCKCPEAEEEKKLELCIKKVDEAVKASRRSLPVERQEEFQLRIYTKYFADASNVREEGR